MLFAKYETDNIEESAVLGRHIVNNFVSVYFIIFAYSVQLAEHFYWTHFCCGVNVCNLLFQVLTFLL